MNYLYNYISSEDMDVFSEQEREQISKTVVRQVHVNLKNRCVLIDLLTQIPMTQSLTKNIEKIIRQRISESVEVTLKVSIAIPTEKIHQCVRENWGDLLEYLFSRVPAARLWMMGSYFNVRGNKLYVYIQENGLQFPHKRKVANLLQEYLVNHGFLCEVAFHAQNKGEDYDIGEEDRELVKEALSQVSETPESIDTRDSNILMGKPIALEPTIISSIEGEMAQVVVEGEVFDLDYRELRNNVLLVSFGITDFTDSIRGKVFLSGGKRPLKDKLKNGLWIKIRGRVEHNKYSQEYELIPQDIVLGQRSDRQDLSSEKRVELHLHTRYSTQDALCSPKDVINQAKKWGHSAVAFTDHGVVQSFPEVYNAAKGSGVKPIYGLEAYIFDDIAPVMANPPRIKISDCVFVVVDIETTGLSFDSDDIIEIGAVKICKGQVIDSFGSFVKPTRPLPANITKLTGITTEMVKDAPPLSEVLPSFMDFLSDAVFVAHNASFDAGFINRDCQKLGLKFDNSILDTLALARVLLTYLKNHRLNTIAKKFNISMGSHHRAKDDANTAGAILIELLNMVGDISYLSDLNDIYHRQNGIIPLNTYHATILVKNQKGLRQLYELVSISHLDYFYRHPRIPKSLLNSHRDGLIIGSGCQAGELYQYLLQNSRDDLIEELVNFYDFLEIQPLSNNAFLLDNGRVSNINRLENINRRIYELGKKYKKPVVLTGDVHFINPEDDIYRKILLAAQGFQDADKDSDLYFRTTDEMLKECEYLGEEAAWEVVVENTQKIADEVENEIRPVPEGLHTPKIDGAEEDIIKMTYEKARNLYGDDLPEIVEDRIDRELKSIVDNGFAVIYLIAHKLVSKSLEDGYLVGSRGSVGSSLVATMCGITQVNPLPPHYRCPHCKFTIFPDMDGVVVGPDLPEKSCPKCDSHMIKDGFNIPFEVFMGFEGDKVPDIDLNFSGEYQARAHKYTEKLFGKDFVFRAGTISTIAEKTAYGYAKSFVEERGIDASSTEIKRLSNGIIGVKRTTGQHPGGVMVVPKDMKIFDFTPVQHPADDRKSGVITTHFDYHSISDQLLKLDLLGHDDPTMIKMLEEITGIDAMRIPLDDPKTMSLFSSLKALDIDAGNLGTTVGTLGVPEFGTRFVRQMLEDTRPTTFSELVRISGLSHGTDVWLNNAQELIKNQVATLKDVIATRDDIMIYLINKGIDPKISFNIMERVRKGKQLEQQQEELLRTRGIEPWFIESCKKIKYLFPKAHAVAYVIMAFRIAYFKVHHPEAFYATYFTARSDDFDAQLILQGPKAVREAMSEIEKREREASAKEKNLLSLLEVVNEMYLRGINFIPINLYQSEVKKFKVTSDGILPPISALQGLGITAALNIDRERKNAPFSSREDLKNRTRISKNVLQILVENHVLSDLPETDQLSLF